MLDFELAWVNDALSELLGPRIEAGEPSVVANIGSGPRPGVERFSVSSSDLVRFVNVDIEMGRDVQIGGDLMDPKTWDQVRSCAPSLIMMTNVLEHVLDVSACLDAMNHYCSGVEHIIVTVPTTYPFHPDPIDTGLRLHADELARLFSGRPVLRSETLTGSTFAALLISRPAMLVKTALAGPFTRRTRSRIAHLARRVEVACVALGPAHTRTLAP